MQISNFRVSAPVAALGERVTVSFDVTASPMLESMLSLDCGKLGIVIFVRDSDWQLGNGKTERIITSVDIASLDGSLEDTLSTTRAIAETAWTVRGYNTVGILESVEIQNPITYINVRCSPAIEMFEVERSSSGEADESGVYLMLDAKLALAANADQPSMRVHMHYAENGSASTSSPYIDLTSERTKLLGGVEGDTSLVKMAFSNASAWNYLLVFGDEYESASVRRDIYKAFANVHFSGRKNGGVAFGGFSSSTDNNPMFECHYPSHFYNPVYFHGGIALGGMKDISTEEVDTGVRWLNGKTIYAKTLVYTGAAGNTAYSLNLPAGVEQVWLDMANSVHFNANGQSYSPNAIVSNVAVFLCILNNSGVTFRTGNSTGGDFYIRVFYTKTSINALDTDKLDAFTLA